jgi:hypothetical protein
MKNQTKEFWQAFALLITGMSLTGCICTGSPGSGTGTVICKANQDEGLPIITCQPMDVDTRVGGEAKFKVEATGTDLAYQWYFQEAGAATPVPISSTTPQTSGGETPALTVGAVSSAKVGSYWCEIDGTGKWGFPLRTRTRNAHLGIAPPSGGPGGGGSIQVFPPQQGSLPYPKSGSSTCGTYCGWINFQNGGLGYDPDAGNNTGRVRVSVGTPGPPYISNGAFLLRWYDSVGGTGCGAISGTEHRSFPINSSRLYCFTVYFVGTCPPSGSMVFLDLEFAP